MLMSLQMSLALPHCGEQQSLLTKDNVTDISSSNLTFRKENSSSQFSANEKSKSYDLSSPYCIKPHLWEAIKTGNSLIPLFFSQKATILYAKNGGFIGKKRRF